METYQTINLGRIKTSKEELIDITKAWIILSLAFALAYGEINAFNGNLDKAFTPDFLILVLLALITAGIGFLFHELGHKFVAQYYGCLAEFRAFNTMLYLALGLAAVIGFIFAAPGAVMIAGSVTLRENGKISLAGPLVNYGLALVFLAISLLVPKLIVGYHINVWLGLFNLIPFGNFDGKKILDWHRYVWLSMLVGGLLLLLGVPKLV